MSARLVFWLSATRSLTSWPSVGPVTSSTTTLKEGTPGGIRGWSQQSLTGAAFSVLQPKLETAERARAAVAAAMGPSGKDILRERIEPPRGPSGEPERTPDRGPVALVTPVALVMTGDSGCGRARCASRKPILSFARLEGRVLYACLA